MRIGVLGAGGMASALAGQWVRAGHEVLIGARKHDRAAALAARIGAAAGGPREAAAFGEVVLVAIRHDGVLDAVRAAGGELRGKTVVDCTNPLAPGDFTLATGHGPSIAERIADVTGAHVVKAFSLCHDDIWRMTSPVFDGERLSVPLCGDDEDALTAVAELVTGMGCTPVRAGGLARAHLVEATAAFVIGLLFAGLDPRAALPPFEAAVR